MPLMQRLSNQLMHVMSVSVTYCKCSSERLKHGVEAKNQKLV